MKTKAISVLLISTISSILMLNSTKAETKFQKTYSCIEYQGNPTTVVNTERGIIKFIVWKSEIFQSSGWTPLLRCQEVSKRFQQFYNQGTLRLITNGIMNRQPVICIAQKKAGQGLVCQDNGLLLTLEPNDNPQQVMQDLFDQNRLADGNSPLVRGEQMIVDIDNFLDKAPVIEPKPVVESKPVIKKAPIIQNNPNSNTIPRQPEKKPSSVTNSRPEIRTGVECPPILCD